MVFVMKYKAPTIILLKSEFYFSLNNNIGNQRRLSVLYVLSRLLILAGNSPECLKSILLLTRIFNRLIDETALFCIVLFDETCY